MDGLIWVIDLWEELSGSDIEKYNKNPYNAYRKEIDEEGKTVFVLKDMYKEGYSSPDLGSYLDTNQIKPKEETVNYSFIFNGDVNDENKLSDLIKKSINRDSTLKLYGGL